MAASEFYYTLNNSDLDAFRSEGIRRFEIFKSKSSIDSSLSATQMYDLLFKPLGRILCVISRNKTPVGMAVLVESEDLFRGKKILAIEVCQIDSAPDIFEDLYAEIDRLAHMDGYDVVQFAFTRKGWLRKMKMQADKGYKVTMNIAEKEYGRRQ